VASPAPESSLRSPVVSAVGHWGIAVAAAASRQDGTGDGGRAGVRDCLTIRHERAAGDGQGPVVQNSGAGVPVDGGIGDGHDSAAVVEAGTRVRGNQAVAHDNRAAGEVPNAQAPMLDSQIIDCERDPGIDGQYGVGILAIQRNLLAGAVDGGVRGDGQTAT